MATQPTFKILRSEKGSRYVLVSDVSGSMVDFVRILNRIIFKFILTIFIIIFENGNKRIASRDCTNLLDVGLNTIFLMEADWDWLNSSKR